MKYKEICETEISKMLTLALLLVLIFGACQNKPGDETKTSVGQDSTLANNRDSLVAISEPLVTHMYTADPSAHVFDGRVYVYPSHDIEVEGERKGEGGYFDMKDYHVFSMDSVGGKVTDHGVALDIEDVSWAGRQMWAPDAAHKDGTYYLYFPVKDKEDIFRIGVATSQSPTGPFLPKDQPMSNSYSIDPAVFKDSDGSYYMYLGGIRGGQLQNWQNEEFDATGTVPSGNEIALLPKVAKLRADMLEFDGPLRDVQILDENGKLLLAGDNDRRFFEAAWVHKFNDKYYFSYSTGDTHYIAYATGDSPYGPFTYRGVILNPVIGWTNHHSIVEHKGQWYIFYHDSSLSGGKTNLRNIKVTELTHNPDGTIETIDAYVKK